MQLLKLKMLAGNKLSLKKLKGASTNLLNEQKKIYEDENQKYNFIVKNYDKTYNNFKNNLFWMLFFTLFLTFLKSETPILK